MTEPAVQQLAKQLMTEHGLIEKGWTFDLDRAVSRRGCCHHWQKRITVSGPLSRINEDDKIRNTLLHEIAHALLPSNEGHGKKWKELAISIGCSGERASRGWNEVERTHRYSRYRYEGECPNCHITMLRKQRRNIACGQCCKKYANNKYDPKYKITWKEVGEDEGHSSKPRIGAPLFIPTGFYGAASVADQENESRTCRVCGVSRPRSDFSPDRNSKSMQCKNCSYFRSHLYGQGITPCPNEIIKLMVLAAEGVAV